MPDLQFLFLCKISQENLASRLSLSLYLSFKLTAQYLLLPCLELFPLH